MTLSILILRLKKTTTRYRTLAGIGRRKEKDIAVNSYAHGGTTLRKKGDAK